MADASHAAHATPPPALFRVALAPDPVAWPDWRYVGGGRFDDPQRSVRVLYAATQRRAAFIETLARFRPPLGGVPGSGRLSLKWLATRRIASFSVRAPGSPWLDLHAPATIQSLRHHLAPLLVSLGHTEFDMSHALSQDRRLSQAIGRWAIDRGFAGIAYPSRFDPHLDLWAIFDGVTFNDVTIAPITEDDPDLLAVVRLFTLTLAP